MKPLSHRTISRPNLLCYLTALLVTIMTTIAYLFPESPHSFTTSFPILVINVHQGERINTYSDVFVNASMQIIASQGVDKAYSTHFPSKVQNPPVNTFSCCPLDPRSVTTSYNVGIHVRGQSSRLYHKKSYAMKVWDKKGEEQDVSFFGMSSNSNWILYSSSVEPTLMRNKLAFYFSTLMGAYAPRMQYVEVFLAYGGADVVYPTHYIGVYLLSEKISRDKDRVDVHKMKVEDDADASAITGGYIFKVDKADMDFDKNEDIRFRTNRTEFLSMVYPSHEVATPAKVQYLTNYLTTFESLLANGPYNGTSYSDLIVVKSFVDMLILQEFSKNEDAYRLSAYFYKERNKQISSGPVWDMDRTWGNSWRAESLATSGWLYNSWFPWFGANPIPFWWTDFMKDPKFVGKLVERWHELRSNGGILSNDAVKSNVDSLFAEVRANDAHTRDYLRWGPYWYRFAFWWPDYHTHNAEKMRSWMLNRLKWMDSKIYAMRV